MAKENIIGVMVLFTKDNGKIIKSKAQGHISIQMGENMKDNGK